jgi:hypothetical protein
VVQGASKKVMNLLSDNGESMEQKLLKREEKLKSRRPRPFSAKQRE